MTIILLTLVSATFRLLPHPANFVPITALALFVSAKWGTRRGALALLGSMVLSDLVLGTYDPKLMAVVYGSLVVTALIGRWVGKNISARRIVVGSLASSVFFYLTTNFAVWAFSPWYAHNAAGLIQSYVLAAPFFRNAALGDLLFSGMFFGAYALLRKLSAAPPLIALSPEPVKGARNQ
jgi:hypothetical protein